MVIAPNPTLAPVSLRKYGVTPFGDCLYRCVYAPSVKRIVGGRAKSGAVGYFVRPAYRHIGDYWILEKWTSAFDDCGKTEAQYNELCKDMDTGLFPTGPYPHRGVYNYCETLSSSPADTDFDLLIALINKGKYNRPQDNAQALMNTMERKEKADADERFDRMKELLPAFGIRATSYRGHTKKTKSAPIMKSANELGLPRSGPSVLKVNHAI